MTELETQIYEAVPTEAGKIESKPITDDEIAEANELFKSGKDGARLVELKAKRDKEINVIFPEFSHKVIYYGLKEKPEESVKQFNAAVNFYNGIIEMEGKPDEIRRFALRLEKLQNWDINPKRIEDNFENFVENKKNKFDELIKATSTSGRRKFLEKKGAVEKNSNREMDRFGGAITKQSLEFMADFPDYRREAVIYYPKFAEDWRDDLVKTFRNNKKIKMLAERHGISQVAIL